MHHRYVYPHVVEITTAAVALSSRQRRRPAVSPAPQPKPTTSTPVLPDKRPQQPS